MPASQPAHGGTFIRSLADLSGGGMSGRDPSGNDTAGSIGGDGSGGPTALRIALGAQLRRLREVRGITRDDAADVIRASVSKISRMELGRVGLKHRDLADLLTLYGVTDEQERAKVLALAQEAAKPGWWHQYGDILPAWFEFYVGLEAAASLIRTYEVQFVPGLLQTPGYARAVITLGIPGASDEEVEQRVRMRMERQQLLTRPDGPKLWAVVDETALRRRMGGPGVMEAQLEHLIGMTKLPNVTLYILPLNMGYHAAAAGAFSILRFAAPELPDIVYLEQLTSALYLEKRRDVDHYAAVMDQLCVQAEKRAEAADVLTGILSQLG